jgi:hypothetical protein
MGLAGPGPGHEWVEVILLHRPRRIVQRFAESVRVVRGQDGKDGWLTGNRPDAVDRRGEMTWMCLALLDRVLKQWNTCAAELVILWGSNRSDSRPGMLEDKPCRVGAVLPDHGPSGPTTFVDDHPQTGRVRSDNSEDLLNARGRLILW